MNVVHVIINNMGGIHSLVQNLILYKGEAAMPQEVIALNVKGNQNQPAVFLGEMAEISHFFLLNPKANWYYTYRRLARALSKSKGVLVSNDQYDLIMLRSFNIPRKVVQLVHDPYNLDLSLKFQDVIDCFIAHSKYIYDTLLIQLPQRSEDIIYLPYGIPKQVASIRTFHLERPLQLVFLGRHDKAKGVYDLYMINQILKTNNIHVTWVILGKGPETDALQKQWQEEENVKFFTPPEFSEVLQLLADADVMVFPTKFEGFPVALIECMSQGCVPVVSDLPGGIQEIVEDGVTGYKCKIDATQEFAEKIISLHNNREKLFRMQLNAIEKVAVQFNAEEQSPKYQKIFKRVLESNDVPRHHYVNCKIGSRLDQSWIPDFFVTYIRNKINNKNNR
jgi:glycosyltransferase involved in cell wall biosynthesis